MSLGYKETGKTAPIEMDQRLQTEQVTSALLNYIIEKIVDQIEPKQIVLFGSRARGEEDASSDIDLFIVQDREPSNRDVRRKIEYLLWGRRFGIDLIVRRPEDVARNLADHNPFYTQHIYSKGQILYERPA